MQAKGTNAGRCLFSEEVHRLAHTLGSGCCGEDVLIVDDGLATR
jgi:hypothetical protein